MLLPFIIPVYNRAAILHECIDSILKSSWHDYELILVDDASTDQSGLLCDRYEEQYSFIHTVHLSKNQGPGVARNYGLNIFNGCDYCAGRPQGVTNIPAAIQTKSPLDYQKF